MRNISPNTLSASERNFHEVIRDRAEQFIRKHNVELPDLAGAVSSSESDKQWFPIPGMYGGFSYWFDGEGDEVKLISESWSRIIGGSGERHDITAGGSDLVDEGFV